MDDNKNSNMMTDNDLLLQQFFAEAAKQEIADDGFTERVMQRLPKRATFNVQRSTFNVQRSTFNVLWTLFCCIVFAVLFVVFDGWHLLAVHFEVLLRTLPTESFTINPVMLAATLFGLLFVAVGEAVSRA